MRLRELLHQERFGVLASISARKRGWPFASTVAYALTAAGDPLLLLSDLAEHTRNVRLDGRASLLVQDGAARTDPQAGGRVTLLGTIELVSPEALAGSRERYVARHPDAAPYCELTDFRLYVLGVDEARLIGGFGAMGWLSGDSLRRELSLD